MANDSQIGVMEGDDKAIAAFTFTEDTVVKVAERVAFTTGAVELIVAPVVDAQVAAGVHPPSTISITGRARIILKSSFSDNSSTAKIRLVFYDSVGTLLGVSEEYEILNTGILGSGTRFLGSLFVLANEVGASTFRIQIIDGIVGDGNLSMWVGVL